MKDFPEVDDVMVYTYDQLAWLCSEFGDCADPRIAVYQQTADNIKKLVNPETPVWKPY
mgnify:CR=1 FL=1